jgi:hypothetical protein
MPKIERTGDAQKIRITNSISTTAVIAFKDDGSLMIHTPSTWTSADLTFYSKNPVDGVYNIIKNANGDALTITVAANEAREAPTALFPAHEVKIVASSGTNNSVDVGITTKG